MFNIVEDELYTLDEAAERARMTRQKFANIRKEGQGPKVTELGGKKLISSPDFNEWVIRENPHLSTEEDSVAASAAEAISEAK